MCRITSVQRVGDDFGLVLFGSLHPSQQLWSCQDVQFTLGTLDLAVNQYFVHILSLVTDNNPS